MRLFLLLFVLMCSQVACYSVPKLVRPQKLPPKKIAIHKNKSGYARWVFPTNQPIVSTPALGADGTIYISSLDRKLFAVTPFGKKRWQYEGLDDLVLSSPATAIDGTVYIGCKDSYLYAIKPNGRFLRKFGTQGVIDSSPFVRSDGTILIASHDANLYAVSPSGKQLWTYQAQDKFRRATPAEAADGTLYIGSQDGFLHAISAEGKRKWFMQVCNSQTSSPPKITASPTVDTDGTIYIGCWDGRFQAISPEQKIKWTFKTKAPILGKPILGRDGTIYIGSDDKTFYALNPKDPQNPRWVFRSGRYLKKGKVFKKKPVKGSAGFIQSSAALDTKGRIYFGAANEYLYALSSKGSLLWQFDAGGWIDNAPIIKRHDKNAPATKKYGKREVIYIAAGRRLYAINP